MSLIRFGRTLDFPGYFVAAGPLSYRCPYVAVRTTSAGWLFGMRFGILGLGPVLLGWF